MTTFEIWRSVDGSVSTMFGSEQTAERRRYLTSDDEGQPMEHVKTFEAADYEEARRVFEESLHPTEPTGPGSCGP